LQRKGNFVSTNLLDRPPIVDTARVDAAPAFDRMPLLVVLAGTFMTFLDFFIVNVALPSIQTGLGAGVDAVQLVIAGYGLAFAVGMISGGRLGDLYGRRRMFSIGLALFTVTSLACGVAPSIDILVAARVLQGVAGAMLTPQVLAILSAVYDETVRPKAFAAYGFAMGIAGVLGQLIGGALIDANVAGLGWRSIFLINVPVGVVTLTVVKRYVPEARGERASLDAVGTALITVVLVAVVLPLVVGREHGWPMWSIASLASAPALAAIFVAHQARRGRSGKAPLLDLRLFRNRSFTIGSLTGMAFGCVPPATFFVLALYLQQGRGFSPLFSGEVFGAVGVGYFLALVLATPIAARIGHQVLALGAGEVAVGCFLLALTADTTHTILLTPGLALVGFGIGLVLVPLSATVLRHVEPAHLGSAAGVLSTAQQVGGALGVALVGVVFFPAVSGGIPHAFRLSLVLLAGLTSLTAVLTQVLVRESSAAPRTAR
jgi:EmrB/QacA subfamily drug resistance transporter